MKWLALAVAAVLLVGGGAGWLAAGAVEDPPVTPPKPSTARVGPVTLRLPAAWRPSDTDEEPPQTWAIAPGLPATAELAFSAPQGAALVPGALAAGVPADAEPRRARLAGLDAWSYGDLDPNAAVRQVVVAPTDEGVLGVACVASGGAVDVALDCHSGLEAADLGGVRPLAPSRDLAFRRALPAVLGPLDASRVRGRRALRANPKSPAVARRLAAAHDRGAEILAPLAPPGRSARLVAALRRTADAYVAFARDPVTSRGRVQAAETALRRALSRLR